MLAAYLSTSQALERYRCGPAGPYLDEFVEWLEKRGYRARTIRRYLLSAHRFSRWMQNTDGCLQEGDEPALESFGVYLHQQYGLKSSSPHLAQTCIGARRFMAFLDSIGKCIFRFSEVPMTQ